MHRKGDGVEQNQEEALKVFDKACSLKDADACYLSSAYYLSGKFGNVKQDLPKAFDYALKACNLGKIQSYKYFLIISKIYFFLTIN